jgi:hypothetical protein
MNFFKQLDKQLHIITCVAWVILFQFFMPLSCAIQATLLIGIGKEIYDRAHPETHTADVMDILADAIGIYIGAAFMLLIHHLNK